MRSNLKESANTKKTEVTGALDTELPEHNPQKSTSTKAIEEFLDLDIQNINTLKCIQNWQKVKH